MPTLSSDDLAACRQLLKVGSQSFHAASLLLPRRVRDPATALYAFCRLADDAVDAAGAPGAAVDRLRERVDRAYAGRPHDTPADRAFAALVEGWGIPRVVPDALVEGFAWDAAGRRFDTIDALEAYAVRVAGTVGLMMTLVMGRRDEETLARAVDLGIAMQLGNVARDVGEDARAGRLYLPLDWLTQEGILPTALLHAPRASPALGRVVARLLDRAESRYRRALPGVALLPADCRPAIHAARLVYREIGGAITANRYDSVSRRAVVPGRRKLTLMAGALFASVGRAGHPLGPTVPDGDVLVRAAARAPVPKAARGLERLIDILTDLENRRPVSRARLEPSR